LFDLAPALIFRPEQWGAVVAAVARGSGRVEDTGGSFLKIEPWSVEKPYYQHAYRGSRRILQK